MCTICKETKSEVIKASDAYHQYGSVPTVVDGQNVYECSVCHYLRKEVINCEHTYKVYKNTATCTEPGEKISVCTKCGDIKTEAVAALGHDVDLKADDTRITLEKTCTTDGAASGTCERCKKSVSIVIPASHNFGDEENKDQSSDKSKYATCEKDGYISKICLDCDYQVLETVKAKGHAEPTDKSEIKYYAVAPIFDDKGVVVDYESYKTSSKNPIDLTDTISTMTPSEIKEILCDYGIVKVYKCNSETNKEEYFEVDEVNEHGEDGEVEVEFYAYVGHKYITTVEPTCTKDGKEVCTVCGHDEPIDKLGHDFTGNDIVMVEKANPEYNAETAPEKPKTKLVPTALCNRCNKVVDVDVKGQVETDNQPKLNSEDLKSKLDDKVDTREEKSIDRSTKVDVVTTPVKAENANNYNYNVVVTQKQAFDSANTVDDKENHSNCICIVLDIGIEASKLEVVSGDYEIGPDDIKEAAVKQWTGESNYKNTQFIVWLLPSEMGNGYTITFREKGNEESYPISVTFTFEGLKAN